MAAVVHNYRSASQQFEVACLTEADSIVVFDKTELVTVAGSETVMQSFRLWQVGPGIEVDCTDLPPIHDTSSYVSPTPSESKIGDGRIRYPCIPTCTMP